MRLRVLFAIVGLAAAAAAPLRAQRPPADPAAPAPRVEPAMVSCPSVLGDGVLTARTYCDVSIERDPAAGIIVTLPAHAGPATLLFDLHNRHVYSEEMVKARKAFARYTASIGVLTMNNDLVSRAAILSEFRTEADLFDRIGNGGGAAGLKAVAPTGAEPIAVAIPEGERTVSIMGEKLQVERIDAVDHFGTVGRPIAVISNVRVRYTPAPPPEPESPPRR